MFIAYGVGDELQQLNPDGPSMLSDMMGNHPLPPLMKDMKNNELNVSLQSSHPSFSN